MWGCKVLRHVLCEAWPTSSTNMVGILVSSFQAFSRGSSSRYSEIVLQRVQEHFHTLGLSLFRLLSEICKLFAPPQNPGGVYRQLIGKNLVQNPR